MNISYSLMTDTVEGSSITYWAEIANVKRNQEKEVISFYVRDGGHKKPRVTDKWVFVNENKIRRAAKSMREGEVDCRRDIQTQFVGKEWEYDFEGIDCLIQYIAFGDVIYG